MDKAERKNRLIQLIQQIEDPIIIEEIYRLLDVDIQDNVYETNEEQKKAIDAALIEIKKGKTLTEREANKQVAQWLNQKE